VVGLLGVLSAVALYRVLPELPATAGGPDDPAGHEAAGHEAGRPPGVRARLAAVPAALGSGPLPAICLVTMIVVIGDFAAYTYITALVRRDAGLSGLGLSAVLFAYGAAGIAGIVLAGRITDRRPRRAEAAAVGGIVLALAGLATVAHGSTAGTVAA